MPWPAPSFRLRKRVELRKTPRSIGFGLTSANANNSVNRVGKSSSRTSMGRCSSFAGFVCVSSSRRASFELAHLGQDADVPQRGGRQQLARPYPSSMPSTIERTAGTLLLSGRRLLPHQKEHPRHAGLLGARSDQRSALLQARPNQLPQSAHLSGAGAATRAHSALRALAGCSRATGSSSFVSSASERASFNRNTRSLLRACNVRVPVVSTRIASL